LSSPTPREVLRPSTPLFRGIQILRRAWPDAGGETLHNRSSAGFLISWFLFGCHVGALPLIKLRRRAIIEEASVNQIVSKRFLQTQQMQWTKKVHISCCKCALRCDERLEETFRDWYPHFPTKLKTRPSRRLKALRFLCSSYCNIISDPVVDLCAISLFLPTKRLLLSHTLAGACEGDNQFPAT
jgi:hypothetical protein